MISFVSDQSSKFSVQSLTPQPPDITKKSFWVNFSNHNFFSRSQRVSREGPFRGYKDCNPETDIVFHKTHKCSSSTVQNILLRYGLKHELNVVLPKSGNYLGQKSSWRTAKCILVSHNNNNINQALSRDKRIVYLFSNPMEWDDIDKTMFKVTPILE